MVRFPAGPSERSRESASASGWLPLVIAFFVFFQVAYLGLRPALAEERRLGKAEAELEERLARAEDEGRELERLLEAQSDPMYRERERRALLDPESPIAAETTAAEGAEGPEESISGLDGLAGE